MNRFTNTNGNRADGFYGTKLPIHLGSKTILILAIGLILVCKLCGQDGMADLQIQVYDIGKNGHQKIPLAGALVSICQNGGWVSRDTTSSNGLLHYTTLKSGIYTIVGEKNGYFEDSNEVTLIAGINSQFVISLMTIQNRTKDSVINI